MSFIAYVYHATRPTPARNAYAGPLVHAATIQLSNIDDHELALKRAYYLTQSTKRRPWTANEHVEAHIGPNPRSTTAGDVITLQSHTGELVSYECTKTGFTPLAESVTGAEI